jgi:hypothetical protein
VSAAPAEPPQRLYTAEEAAEFFPDKTANWLKTQARQGKIPCTRIGRTYSWTDADISEIIAAGRQRPVPVLAARTPARKRAAATARSGNALKAKVPPRKRGGSA